MIVNYNDKKLKFPDFLIVGAARSGTTYLYSVLSGHSQVFMPAEKEPQFFCDYGKLGRKTIADGKIVKNWQNYNIDQYSTLFQRAKREQIWGEASVDYLYEYQITIDNIKKIYQKDAEKLKIIIILRNPVDRIWSHYLFHYTKNSDILSFSKAIRSEVIGLRLEAGLISNFDYVGYGLYADKVKAWQENFPHIRIWIYEEFFNDLERYMLELTNFLSIETDDRLIVSKKVNSSGVAKHKVAQFFIDRLQKPEGWKKPIKQVLPQRLRQRLKRQATQKLLQHHDMDPILRRQLLDFYRDDIKKLEGILNRDLDIWLKSNNPDHIRGHV